MFGVGGWGKCALGLRPLLLHVPSCIQARAGLVERSPPAWIPQFPFPIKLHLILYVQVPDHHVTVSLLIRDDVWSDDIKLAAATQ